MRRTGLLPGVLYGHGREPMSFATSEHELRAVLKQGHALMDLALAGETIPVIVKDQQHHPVRGGFTHIDLFEVSLKEKIESSVPVELTGTDDAPGVIGGGVLDHAARELTIESLPTEIPDSLTIDVSTLEMNATLTLADAVVTPAVTILDDPDTVIATITPPSRVEAPETVEEETAVVGEADAPADTGEAAAEGEAE